MRTSEKRGSIRPPGAGETAERSDAGPEGGGQDARSNPPPLHHIFYLSGIYLRVWTMAARMEVGVSPVGDGLPTRMSGTWPRVQRV